MLPKARHRRELARNLNPYSGLLLQTFGCEAGSPQIKHVINLDARAWRLQDSVSVETKPA